MNINIKFATTETLKTKIQSVFNELIKDNYPQILTMNHYELWKLSGKFSPEEWKEFRLDERVDHWYTEEILLMTKNKAYKLLQTAGDNKSVAEAQALSATLGFIKQQEINRPQEPIIIYTFVPLNEYEEQAPNVKVVQNIPSAISNALNRYTRNRHNEK